MTTTHRKKRILTPIVVMLIAVTTIAFNPIDKAYAQSDEEIPRYDNQLGDDEDAEPTTEFGGGSIVIHDPKGNTQ